VIEQRLQRDREYLRGSYAWRLPANFLMPLGLALHADIDHLKPEDQPEHYLLCPASDMPL
jgi:hypothetical protein